MEQGEGTNKPNKASQQPLMRERGLTYNDYASIDDDQRYELVDGQLELMSPAPIVRHQLISAELFSRLRDTCQSEYIILNAPIDLILSQHNVRQPDLVLVHRSRLHIIHRNGIMGPADLVVEILSPSTLRRDKVDKLKTYARFNVPEYWIVEPILGILEQYVLQEQRYELENVYQGEELVQSNQLRCVCFSMGEIINNIPNIE
jgi:Uma2 family endonuclease